MNTPNYSTLPKEDRPVNAYLDRREVAQVEYYNGGYYFSSGAPTYVAAPGWNTYTMTNIRADFYSLYSASSFDAFAARVSNDAMVELLGKVADLKVNLAVSAAEARKTSDMVVDRITRIYNAMRAFKRGNLRKVAKLLGLTPGTSHKTWLEYKYGWMPFLLEVKGAAELFAQQTLGGRPPRYSVQVKKSSEFLFTVRTTYNAYGGGTSYYDKTLKGSYTTRKKIWVEINNPLIANLNQTGLENPLLIAWELVPLSFVFDWFVSVGQWLEGLTALHGMTVRRVLHSNVNDLTYTFEQPATIRSSGGTTYVNGRRFYTFKQRFYGRGIPSFDAATLSIPRSFDPWNFSRIITTAALARGNTRSFR